MGIVGSLAVGHQRRRLPVSGGGSAPTPAPFSAVAADGWQATVASPTDLSMLSANVGEQGYDTSGNATTYNVPVILTKRVRQTYPNNATPTANMVALNRFLFSTSILAGNASTLVSPKPVCAWAMLGRALVGDTLDWEALAFHNAARLGKQVPCVQVRATDGTTTTPWQTSSTTALSTLSEDPNPLEVFKGALDVSSLATGLFMLQSRVPPWFGGSASVADTADSAVVREFSPRYFYKDTARAAAPPLAYVQSTGSDTTGVWSTTAATAAATPFLTVGGAIQALDNATRGTPATGGFADGCRVRIVDTVSLGTCTTSRPQKVASIVVERAPGTTRANAVVTMTAAMRTRLGVGTLLGGLTEGAIKFYDVTISRTVNTTFSGETANQLNVQFHNCTIANNGTAGSWLANAHDWFLGVQLTGFNGNLGQTTLQHRLMRGMTVDFANGNAPEAWVTVGCNFTRVKGCAPADATKGAIWYNNKFLNPDGTTAAIEIDTLNSGETLGPVVVLQNVFDPQHTTMSTPMVRISSDTPKHGNTINLQIGYNSGGGYGSLGRENLLYDNSSEVRTHTQHAFYGNLFPQINTKGDVFTQDATHIGQFPFTHGVGCEGNISQFAVNSPIPDSEMQTYPGIGSLIGTNSQVPQFANSAIWVNYRGSTGSAGVAVAGTGISDFTLASGSPAIGRLSDERLGRDIVGNVRNRGSAGAYA